MCGLSMCFSTHIVCVVSVCFNNSMIGMSMSVNTIQTLCKYNVCGLSISFSALNVFYLSMITLCSLNSSVIAKCKDKIYVRCVA